MGVIRKLRKLLFEADEATGTVGAAKTQNSNSPKKPSSVAEVSSIQFDQDLARLLAEMGRDGKPLLAGAIELARESGAVSYAHSANTLGLAPVAFKVGFQYVDGPAVHLASSHPRPAVRLKPMIKARSGASKTAR